MSRVLKPSAEIPIPPIAGPRSIAHRIQPAWRVVKNMERLRHDELAVHTGVAALRNLADDTLPEEQQKVVEAGAIEAVIAAMQAHPSCAGLQVCGAGTLVVLANIDSHARKRAVEAGAILELAAAVKRLEIHNEGDGEKFGSHVIHKANFARDCLLKVAGKPGDPRNQKHIQAALKAGVDPALFTRKDAKTRAAEEEEAHERYMAQKAADEEAHEVAAGQKPWVGVPESAREVAALFPGQGTQKKGMADKILPDPSARALFTLASKILGYDLAKLISEGPQEKLDQTLYSQPAIFVTSLAAMEKAKKEKPELLAKMKTAAGFSLGEYSALVFAGALTFEDGLRVVKARAEAMEQAAKESSSGMASVSGVDDEQLQALLDEASSEAGGEKKGYIANYMFPEGRTCSGDTEVLTKMCSKVTALGGGGKNAKMLNVSGAFHTPYMASAQAKLSQVLDEAEVQMPSLVVYSNVTGMPYESVDEIKLLLKRQLLEPVKWEQGTKHLIEQGHAAYIEPGPGKQLKAMMRRINQQAWAKMMSLE
ncbi:hypothetical protein AB1Y20_004610 [Prymnesium parvum]|uniref:Malonyl-CoA:ACP transacylase (MAT) domain-containing protein n=1 Tax=Prymnesium parvum TaxID=97485 RepID=A0AB34IYK4_PRYPA